MFGTTPYSDTDAIGGGEPIMELEPGITGTELVSYPGRATLGGEDPVTEICTDAEDTS